MKSKDTTIKKVKGYSSTYPNICNLKLLPNIDWTWITIQDDVGTSMTIKLSDLSDFIKTDVLNKIRTEIIQMPTISLNANDVYKANVLAIINKYKTESEE